MNLFIKLLGFTLISIFFYTGCSSDSSTDPTEDTELTTEDFKMEIKEIEVQPNLQVASDTGSLGAMSVLSALELYNSIEDYSTQVIPESANKLAKVIHQTTLDGVTITWETFNLTEYIELEMTYNGKRESDGTVFSNFTKGQVIVFSDGTYCILELFQDNSTSYLMSIEITEEDNGNYIVNFYYMGLMNMTITYMPDGMIEVIDELEDGSKWEATVFEDGTGMYRYYYADGTIWQEDTW